MATKYINFHTFMVPVCLLDEVTVRLQDMKKELVDILWFHNKLYDHEIGVLARSDDGQIGSITFDVKGCNKYPKRYALGECLEDDIPKPIEEKPEEHAKEPEADDYSWWIKLHFEDLMHLEEKADPKTNAFTIPAEMTTGADPVTLSKLLTKNEAKYQVVAPNKDGSIFVKLWKQISDDELSDIADELGF